MKSINNRRRPSRIIKMAEELAYQSNAGNICKKPPLDGSQFFLTPFSNQYVHLSLFAHLIEPMQHQALLISSFQPKDAAGEQAVR